MIYGKLFNNHAEYEAYATSSGYIEPHTSYCVNEGDVQYNKKKITEITVTFENTVWYDNAKIYDSNNNLLLNALRGQENKFILPDNGVIFITMYLLVSVDGVETYGAPTGESFVYKYTIPNGTKTIGLIEGEPS